MERTSLLIPAELKMRAQRHAKALGLSLGDLIRTALERELRGAGDRDPLFADTAIFDGSVPSDFSSHHDDHLYGS